jgi:hypothetical protein
MINTSASVKPRVVIFHIIASQLIRSIASLAEARTVPNVGVDVSAGKQRCLSGKSISWKMLKVESVDVLRSHAEAVAAQ